jgi:hypothetical protein
LGILITLRGEKAEKALDMMGEAVTPGAHDHLAPPDPLPELPGETDAKKPVSQGKLGRPRRKKFRCPFVPFA